MEKNCSFIGVILDLLMCLKYIDKFGNLKFLLQNCCYSFHRQIIYNYLTDEHIADVNKTDGDYSSKILLPVVR